MLSGYEAVGETRDRHLFHLLVHSEREGSEGGDTPLAVWLQGGNGCSSMIGAMTENGPLLSPAGPSGSLRRNPYSLHRLAHVLYLDRPAGAGYSWSEGKANRSWANDNQTAADSVAALRGVLGRYPWLCGREVFVAGESYAGHFTVQMAMGIRQVWECWGVRVRAELAI